MNLSSNLEAPNAGRSFVVEVNDSMIAVDNIFAVVDNSGGVIVVSKFADDVMNVDTVDDINTVLTTDVSCDFVINADANDFLSVVNVIVVGGVVADDAVALVAAFNSVDFEGDVVVFTVPDDVFGTIVINEIDIIFPLFVAVMVVGVVLVTLTGAIAERD